MPKDIDPVRVREAEQLQVDCIHDHRGRFVGVATEDRGAEREE
jgi:hypothetical protein